MWKEIHDSQEHGLIPLEDARFARNGGEDLVVNSIGCGCIGAGGGVQRAGNHDSDLAVPQRDAWQEIERAIHGGIGSDSRAVGRIVGECEALRSGYVGLDGQ